MILTLLRQILARRPSPPGACQPQPGQPQPGQLSSHRPPPGHRPGTATANRRRRTMTVPRRLPHTIQLCIHCRHNPAGFWVSRTSSQTARRPWCLSCCQHLDPGRYHVQPFGS